MPQRQTEMRHVAAQGLDLQSPQTVLALLAQGQAEAARSVESAVPALALGARLAADSLAEGGRLIYAAAGSSGLMALADALELPGTYGIAHDRIAVVLAGGADAVVTMPGGPEDDEAAARAAITDLAPGPADCVIGITASGQTAFPLAALATARAAGARTIAIANNAGAPIFAGADVAICLPTPPEVIAGSTRMGAGTAQKIALNMLSTMMAIHLGHVHDGFMVNVVADNRKLRERAAGIVAAITGADPQRAAAALDDSAGAVKPAILLAAGADSLETAMALITAHGGHLRPALAALADTGAGQG